MGIGERAGVALAGRSILQDWNHAGLERLTRLGTLRIGGTLRGLGDLEGLRGTERPRGTEGI